MYYDLRWEIIENTFTSPNFKFKVVGDEGGYNQDWQTAPVENALIKDRILIAPNTTQSYTISLTLHGTGEEQNYDQGKTFDGKIVVVLVG